MIKSHLLPAGTSELWPVATSEKTGNPRWRPIHYLGSKLRIVEQIRELLDEIDPTSSPVCDLFAGSGTVSAELASTRDVTAIDIQEYSRVLCSATLNPPQLFDEALINYPVEAASSRVHMDLLWASEPLISHEKECILAAQRGEMNPICDLVDGGSMVSFVARGPTGNERAKDSLDVALQETVSRLRELSYLNGPSAVIFRHFGGVYFSYKQSVQICTLLNFADKFSGALRDCLFAASLSTASEIVNTVGRQFAQPMRLRDRNGKPKKHAVQQILRDREADAFSVFTTWLSRYAQISATGRPHRAIRADFEDALDHYSGGIGIVYADPPYTRDHYSRYYHVLETMCRRDDPDVSVIQLAKGQRISRGIYRVDRHQSPFCIKSQAPDAFRRLFQSVRKMGVPLLLSYSPLAATSKPRPRVMGVEDITGIARRFFKRVEVAPLGRFGHNKLNCSKHNSETSLDAEVVFVCS